MKAGGVWAGMRSLVAVCCVVGLVGYPALASGEGPSPSSGLGSPSSSLLTGSPLVVPAVEPLAGGEQAQNAREAQRYSPEAVEARASSLTAFEGLNAGQARELTERLFPKLIDEPAGGMPSLPEGEKVLGFPSDDVAQLALPGGRRRLSRSL